jgi:hypothetical protein
VTFRLGDRVLIPDLQLAGTVIAVRRSREFPMLQILEIATDGKWAARRRCDKVEQINALATVPPV